MKYFRHLVVLQVLFFAVSCASKLDYALNLAGDNRAELESVINHYSDCPQKRAAAIWLIENMPGHVSLGGDYSLYCDEYDSLLSSKRPNHNEDVWNDLIELEERVHSLVRCVYDIETMDSQTLIRDIDAAFDAWQQGQWATHLNFEQFKEWLLPYKCFEGQPIFSWRDSLKSFAAGDIDHLCECYEYLNNPRAAITHVMQQMELMNDSKGWGVVPGGYPILRPKTYVRLPLSTCEDDCHITNMVVKSKGIPICTDFITQWPDKALNHIWCSYPSINGRTEFFDPFMSLPGSSYYPYSRFAKVFRWSYEANHQYLVWVKKNKKGARRLFQDPFFKDVTEEYLETVDLAIKLKSKKLSMGSCIYISVFDNKRWQPVYYGRAWFGRGFFKKMGKRITYIVMDENQTPISDPFEVDALGRVHYLVASKDSTINFRLTRKYPIYNHVFEISALLKGGRMEASNDILFKKSETVAVFPNWPLAASSVSVSQTVPYRYWRFCTSDGEVSDMDEIFLYDSSEGQPLVVTCLPYSSQTFSNMFDGNTLTNYRAEGSRNDGAVDLGTPKILDHISFLRRGDGNVVFPGDVYRISYWAEGEWKLFREITANDIYLDIKGMPSDALYYVEDISNGFQNRIFTVDNDNCVVAWH